MAAAAATDRYGGGQDGGFLAIMEVMDDSNPTNQEKDDKNTANHSMELRRFVLDILVAFEFSPALYSYPGGYNNKGMSSISAD